MGVLDDAIREHLELKLKHGAKEDEVRRQEAEALGAVRREPAPEGGSAEAVVGADEVHVVEPGHAPFETGAREAELADDSEPFAGEEGGTAFEERAAPPPLADEPLVERGASDYAEGKAPDDEGAFSEGGAEEAGWVESREISEDTVLIERDEEEAAVVEESEPPLAGERSARDAVLEPSLEEGLADEEAALEAERSAEALDEGRPREAREADPAEVEGDVLEDTPDFLQETPEHDRLWFEQKPPRDFDFD